LVIRGQAAGFSDRADFAGWAGSTDRAGPAAGVRAGLGDIAAGPLEVPFELLLGLGQTCALRVLIALQRGPLLLMALVDLRYRNGAVRGGAFAGMTRLHLFVLLAVTVLHLPREGCERLPGLSHLLANLTKPLLDRVLGTLFQFRPSLRQRGFIGIPLLLPFAVRLNGARVRTLGVRTLGARTLGLRIGYACRLLCRWRGGFRALVRLRCLPLHQLLGREARRAWLVAGRRGRR
jgi:hypothetical protein